MGSIRPGQAKAPYVGLRSGGGIGPGDAQPGICVARTTSLTLDGTQQHPTFDTVVKSDPTGKFAFTAPSDTITISDTGSYRVSVYLTTRNESAMLFKLTLFNNGVEIPNIATFLEEGNEQIGIEDEYQTCLAIEAINLTAGTVKVMVQEVTHTGTDPNLVEPNLVWSMAQNNGLVGADGTDAPNSFSRDEFFVFLDSDTPLINLSLVPNAFKDAAQATSKMSVLYDKGGVVDAANAKVILTEGTWEITFFLATTLLESGDWPLALINEDPDGLNVTIFEGTLSDRATGQNGTSMVRAQIKVTAGDEFGFFANSNDSSSTVRGGTPPMLTYAYGYRINTDPT